MTTNSRWLRSPQGAGWILKGQVARHPTDSYCRKPGEEDRDALRSSQHKKRILLSSLLELGLVQDFLTTGTSALGHNHYFKPPPPWHLMTFICFACKISQSLEISSFLCFMSKAAYRLHSHSHSVTFLLQSRPICPE